jgi:hypothetical protein
MIQIKKEMAQKFKMAVKPVQNAQIWCSQLPFPFAICIFLISDLIFFFFKGRKEEGFGKVIGVFLG